MVGLGAGPTVHVEVFLRLRGEDRTLGPVVAAPMVFLWSSWWRSPARMIFHGSEHVG